MFSSNLNKSILIVVGCFSVDCSWATSSDFSVYPILQVNNEIITTEDIIELSAHDPTFDFSAFKLNYKGKNIKGDLKDLVFLAAKQLIDRELIYEDYTSAGYAFSNEEIEFKIKLLSNGNIVAYEEAEIKKGVSTAQLKEEIKKDSVVELWTERCLSEKITEESLENKDRNYLSARGRWLDALESKAYVQYFANINQGIDYIMDQ